MLTKLRYQSKITQKSTITNSKKLVRFKIDLSSFNFIRHKNLFFKKGEDWLVQVYTSDLKGKSFEGTDARVYMSLMDDEDETERIWLNKSNAVDKHKNLFEAGQMDEFAVHASLSLNQPKKVRVGHDNSGAASGWHLKKVVLTHKQSNQKYTYLCDRWLARDEDDGKIERVLTYFHKPIEDEKTPALKIQVKHEKDEESESEHEVEDVKNAGK